MHLTHFLNFVEVNHKTLLISMVLLDTFSAENCQMIRTIEMLNPLIVLFTQKTIDTVFIFEIEVTQLGVPFHYFVQNVEVERKLVYTFDLLNQFSTDGAPYSMVVMKRIEAFSAKSVAAMDQDSWYTLSYIEFVSAVVAKVKASCLIVTLDQGFLFSFGSLKPITSRLHFFSFFSKNRF